MVTGQAQPESWNQCVHHRLVAGNKSNFSRVGATCLTRTPERSSREVHSSSLMLGRLF